MSEFKVVDSNYFMFSFLICYFRLFHFLFWELRIRINMTSLSQHHTSVTRQGHGHNHTVMCHMKKA